MSRRAARSLQDLFSVRVVAHELRGEHRGDDAAALLPAESAELGEVSPRRRSQFASGRACARAALTELGIEPRPILRGEKRAPVWPPGVVGSITHTHAYAAAAVARAVEVRAVGIDAEPDEPLPGGVLRRVVLETELAWLGDADGAPGVAHPDRLVFCIKEATYKAWFPLARRWLGFQDAEVTITAPGRFDVQLLIDGPIASLGGRYASVDGRILAAIEVPVRAGDAGVP